jgi:two-component system, sensor histidine kinase
MTPDESRRAIEAAAHELRQPLQIIAMSLGAVERDDAAKYASALARAKRALEVLEHSVDQCADSLRLGFGEWRPDVKRFELRPLMKELDAEYAAFAANGGVRLRFAVPQLEVRSDPEMLGRLVGNLIVSAVTRTQRGGVLVGARRRAGGVLLQVFDTGGARALQHSGLGFQLAGRLAQALGYTLSSRSVPGKGSCCALVIGL